MSPKLVEVGRHRNIELLTLSEVSNVSGDAGNFNVTINKYPRYIDENKCIACGLCAEKCPKKVRDEYNTGLGTRKAAYVKYSQAVPLKYSIDSKNCIYFLKCKCRACEKFCPTDAINFDELKRERDLKVGSIILSMGSQTYDPTPYDPYGYTRFPNVLTSLEFERMLSPGGPFAGHVLNPVTNEEAKRIAWIQCVGSRDVHEGAKGYCSSVCCTYAIKQALVAGEHVKSGLDAAIFYIDIRTHGKDFERYYNRAREEAGVRFIKSRITSVDPVSGQSALRVHYTNESGRRVEEEFDLIVLSVGLSIPQTSIDLSRKLSIELGAWDYTATTSFAPVHTSRPGIFVCGGHQGPKDIPSSVIDAGAAAGAAGCLLAKSRGSLTKNEEIPQEIDVRGQPVRIGVFVCHCGTNIAGVVDVASVAEYARTLPYVVHVEENLFSCAQDSQEKITEAIKEHNLNRVVVAACTPRTHEELFQQTLVGAGLNKHLFEMANIRNQCSWVHSAEHDAATDKSKDLVRMAVAKAALLQPLTGHDLEVNQTALVVGGGIAGLVASQYLAEQGYQTYLVEKKGVLGGQALSLHRTWKGEDVQEHLRALVNEVRANEKIEVLLNSELRQVDGFVGNFRTTVASEAGEKVLEHGVTVIASGAEELKADHYLYGRSPRVLTGLELDRKVMDNDDSLNNVDSAVFIQCAGSRIKERPYCSKVCCTHSIVSALTLKRKKPEMHVYIVYRDMRPYGLREDLYRSAREEGIHFIRYSFEDGLTVSEEQGLLSVRFTGYVLQKELELRPDLLILASAIVPPKENPLSQMFKVPVNDDGFFVEAHVKLRPVDFSTDGVFLCGLAHSPKPIDESISQAQAAAARAAAVLSSARLKVGGVVAGIKPALCTGCGVCVQVCPYQAIAFDEKGVAVVNEALCKGCGLCVSSCRSGAPSLMGFTDAGLFAQVEACLVP